MLLDIHTYKMAGATGNMLNNEPTVMLAGRNLKTNITKALVKVKIMV
jgi:hypothetical protein